MKGSGDPILAKIVNLTISSLDGSFRSEIANVYSIDKKHFHVPGQSLPEKPANSQRWEQIKKLGISNIDKNEIGILIGADLPEASICTKARDNGSGMPICTKTPFGWSLIGSYHAFESQPGTICSQKHLEVIELCQHWL